MKPELCDAHAQLRSVADKALQLFRRIGDGYADSHEREQLHELLLNLGVRLDAQAIQQCSVSRQLAVLKSAPPSDCDLELVMCEECKATIDNYYACTSNCSLFNVHISRRPHDKMRVLRYRYVESRAYGTEISGRV